MCVFEAEGIVLVLWWKTGPSAPEGWKLTQQLTHTKSYDDDRLNPADIKPTPTGKQGHPNGSTVLPGLTPPLY